VYSHGISKVHPGLAGLGTLTMNDPFELARIARVILQYIPLIISRSI